MVTATATSLNRGAGWERGAHNFVSNLHHFFKTCTIFSNSSFIFLLKQIFSNSGKTFPDSGTFIWFFLDSKFFFQLWLFSPDSGNFFLTGAIFSYSGDFPDLGIFSTTRAIFPHDASNFSPPWTIFLQLGPFSPTWAIFPRLGQFFSDNFFSNLSNFSMTRAVYSWLGQFFPNLGNFFLIRAIFCHLR